MYVNSTYAVYLILSIALTIWVAKTLHRNGRVFLVDAFGGNEEIADSVNHLLVVGFYLINIGFVALYLSKGEQPFSLQESIETLSTKMGVVLLALGFMHFMNLGVFAKIRRRSEMLSRIRAEPYPPVAPHERTATT